MKSFAPPRVRPPLDDEALQRLALGYVGRYATSRAGLCRYLHRKLGERGWAGDVPPDIDAVADRFVALGYIDDRELAIARARSLARRGYGARRLAGALGAMGIARSDAADAIGSAEAAAWDTALRFAERRRIGPYAQEPADASVRRRFFAAMIRAGHAPEHVRKITDAAPGVVPHRDE